jgi:hypothetical protein
MKRRSSTLRLSQRDKRSSGRARDLTNRPRAEGMSPWRALGRDQFRALIASPSNPGRPERVQTMVNNDD